MLQLSNSYINKPILSIRTGGPVGTILSSIINPNNLKIEGYYCTDGYSKNKLILLSQEIRDVIDDGIVVNDHEAMSEAGDLIRLKRIMEVKFDVLNKKVTTSNRQSLGKVTDYAVDSDSMFIQKLYVSQSIVRNFTGGQLSIDRSQIIEITDKKIVVREPTVKVQGTNPLPSPAAA